MPKHICRRWIAACLSLLCASFWAPRASAEVHHKGQWPDDAQERVSLSFEGPRATALRELAKAAGWSIIDSPGSRTLSQGHERVNVYVTDQPASKVLDLLLSDGDYVVEREDKLLSVSATVPAATHAQPQHTHAGEAEPQGTHTRVKDAKDRTVMGSHADIARDEVVDNLTLLGGSTDLYGTVQQDVLVLGGSLTVHDGAHVYGDISVLGGSVELQSGALVDGDLSSAGGHIERSAGARVKGEETSLATEKPAQTKHRDAREPDRWSFDALTDRLGGALSRTALLYAFGCVLLALAGRHMQRMQHELAERPMRAFALGIAAFIGGVIALVALCVTIIGIPVAILLVLVGAVAVYAGMCAVFLELGALLLEERTPSPYLHLALGCAIYLVFSALPFIGWMATCAAVLCGLGLLISTRLAGLFGRAQLTSSPST